MGEPGEERKPKLLLHICCAPCATASIERLQEQYDITGFYYNPNIYPVTEYERRLEETRRFFKEVGLPLVVGVYDPEEWKVRTIGYMDEPEGGRRCRICIELRLQVAALYARQEGFDFLGSVLSISPHKDTVMINELGGETVRGSEVAFLELNLKKKGGFQRSIELSREHDLYRQDYCGCIASLNERDRRKAKKEG